mmetsp:Transcript_20313/g.28031  ORF Transcript_20313/g.28031 Transcript_20313/m.28031 type:complete len:290 (-) Transcript_20313:48-917(-)
MIPKPSILRRLDRTIIMNPNITTRMMNSFQRVNMFALFLSVFDNPEFAMRSTRSMIKIMRPSTTKIRIHPHTSELDTIGSGSFNHKLSPLSRSTISVNHSVLDAELLSRSKRIQQDDVSVVPSLSKMLCADRGCGHDDGSSGSGGSVINSCSCLLLGRIRLSSGVSGLRSVSWLAIRLRLSVRLRLAIRLRLTIRLGLAIGLLRRRGGVVSGLLGLLVNHNHSGVLFGRGLRLVSGTGDSSTSDNAYSGGSNESPSTNTMMMMMVMVSVVSSSCVDGNVNVSVSARHYV